MDQPDQTRMAALPLETESQATRVYRLLRKRIIDCSVAPNEKLKVSPIAEEFDVSPGAVREALSRLTTEYLVTASEQKGFRGAPLSIEELRDLYNTRNELEVRLVRRSVENADVRWMESLATIYGRLCAASRGMDGALTPDAQDIHEKFHRTLVAGCGSNWSLRLFDLLYSASARYRNLACRHLAAHRNSDDEHAAIFNAAMRGDADGVAQCVSEHTRLTLELIEGYLLETQASALQLVKAENHHSGN